MRLANGIVINVEKTFSSLKFSALQCEVRVKNEDGSISNEITRRTYDLKCSMIQVAIPVEILLRRYRQKLVV
ncbi:hypothetical protein BZK37_17810 [Enterococcus casseliflavus]|nr:hypothetical protein BZK37_17810 [Enterococcus casseliflavus]